MGVVSSCLSITLKKTSAAPDLAEGAPKGLNMYPGYEASVRAGAECRRRIFQGADMMTADDVAKHLGMSRQAVAKMRNGRALFGLTNGARSPRFPGWQFEPDVFANLRTLLVALDGMDQWGVYLFLVQGNPLLDDRSPLDLLRAGMASRVIIAARAFAADAA